MRFIDAFVLLCSGLPSVAGRLFSGETQELDTLESKYGEPTHSPSSSPTTCDLTCMSDDDCPRICEGANEYSGTLGTCTPSGPTFAPVTPSPTSCPCENFSNIPDKCEVDILINIMETNVLAEIKLLPQWTRAAFHDAGTFHQGTGQGGANGCLLNDPLMRLEPENAFLDAPLNALADIKQAWHDHPDTCIEVSSADMLQFAIFFATHRQKHTPESLFSGSPTAAAKRDTLINGFAWGRPDANNCDTAWTLHLPDFKHPESGNPISPNRCLAAGKVIKDTMIKLNGFTAREATVLIGAHTIGQVRNTFGAADAGPWVPNGEDTATPDGPVFDNAFHDFLRNTIVENTCNNFATNVAPFTDPAGIFPNWFRDIPNDLDHLDTDVTLAFPSLNPMVHPDYSGFTGAFAADNALFLDEFFQALRKMSTLGVDVTLLSHATVCEDPCGGSDGGSMMEVGSKPLTVEFTVELIKKLGRSMAEADKAVGAVQAGRKGEMDDLTKSIDELANPN